MYVYIFIIKFYNVSIIGWSDIMKKILFAFLISLFLFPSFVNAKEGSIQIKSVELIEKSETTVELEEAKFENLEVWFNVKFFELNDYATYEIVISNESDEDYKINDTNQNFADEKYINYTFDYENDDKVVKAGTEETLVVSISYKNKVEWKDFVNDAYTNENYMNLNFSKVPNVDNPDTDDYIVTFVVIVSIASVLLVFFAFKLKNVMYGVIALALLIPTISKALESSKLDIHTKVEIAKKAELGTFIICSTSHQFEIGMTLYDWLNSEYNTSWSIDDFLMHVYNYSEDIEEEFLVEGAVYYCKSYGECVSPTSMILINMTGDTKLARDIKENDSVVYFDFDTNTMKLGTISKVYIHNDATDFIRYTLEDGSYIEATDYHPIYTKDGWKSYTNRNGYATPIIGDEVKTNEGYKKITNIELYNGKEDFYDFMVVSDDGKVIDNYYANGILVHSAY